MPRDTDCAVIFNIVQIRGGGAKPMIKKKLQVQKHKMGIKLT